MRSLRSRPMRLLVTGGAGYIGSIVARQLLERGHDVTVLDSLYRGHRAAIPEGAAFEAARTVTARDIPVREDARRPGDPPRLVAANAKVRAGLGWTPERSLEDMVRDAWEWHEAHPDGYAS